MIRKPSFIFFLLLAGLFFPLSVMAAISITETIDGEVETHIYHQGQYYNLTGDLLSHRFDSRKNICLAVNHEHRVYIEGDCDDAIKGVNAAFSGSLEEQFSDLSAEEKAMMASFFSQMAGGKQEIKVSVANLGSETFLGVAVEKHLIKVNDIPYSEVWISPAVLKMIEKEFDVARYKAWNQKIEKELLAFQQQLTGQTTGTDPLTEAYEALVKRGYPVKIQPQGAAAMELAPMLSSGAFEASEERQMTAIDPKHTIVPQRLAIPKDYTRAASWEEFMKLDIQNES